MTDHVLYFWFCWIFWVIVTFFMNKSQMRTYLASWVLIAIIFSDYFFRWNSITFSIPFILLIVGAAGMLGSFRKWLPLLVTSFIVAIGYASFLFWEMISPVWLIMPRYILVTLLFGFLISILVKLPLAKIAVCLFGMAGGELIYAFTLADYGLPVTVGDKQSFINFFVPVLFFTFLHVVHAGRKLFTVKTEKYKEKMLEAVK